MFRTFRNIFLTLAFILGLSSSVESVDMRGYVHDSEDGFSGKNIPVKFCTDQDTLYNTTNENGRYVENSNNFDPPQPNIGDTISILAYNGSHTTMLKFLLGTDYNLEATLDNPDNPSKAFTVNLGAPISSGGIKDTSGLPDPLVGVYWLNKNSLQTCTTQVDTGYVAPLTHYWRGWFNFEEQDSVAKHGDSAYISLEKYVADTTYRTLIPFEIDTTWLAAMQAGDSTVWFPLEKIIDDQTPPNISNVTTWPDTSFVGPFDVEATITDAAGIGEEWLKYRLGSVAAESCNADSSVGDIYYYTIPSVISPDSVHYQIKAIDDSQNANVAFWPGPSSNDWHSFYVSPTSVKSNDIEAKTKQFKVWPTLARDKINISGAKSVNIYNVSGRKVAEYNNKNSNCTGTCDLSDVPQGVYFVKPKEGSKETKKVIKIK